MGKRFRTTLCAAGLLLAGVALGRLTAPQSSCMTVLFSPNGGIEAEIVREIEGAQESIDVCAYYFTSEPIARALIARNTQVEVRVILDASQEKSKWSVYPKLRRAGVPVRICRAFPIMHNKFLIIDGTSVETGSYNYTMRAERGSAENALFVHSPTLARRYRREFEKLWDLSAASPETDALHP